MYSNLNKTPIADALLELRTKIVHSFHALPIFRGNSLSSDLLSDKYRALFGANLLGSEMTATGKYFDSFFFPKSVIRESEDAAARLFGADGTLYVTTGTTTSNQIAATALYEGTGPVLIDKRCHQSIHFIFDTLGATIDYIQPEFHCEQSERSAWNFESVLEKVNQAEAAGRSYEVIVLTAQSYEGVIYDIPKILGRLLEAGTRTRKFMVDEAWGAANYFNPALKRLTAMNIDELIARYPDIEVVCTQSSHKSLSTLRQASMIHFRGGCSLRERLGCAKFRVHSTSPSYPILASLDLARAQMESEGDRLLAGALALAEEFKQRLQGEDWLCYRLCEMPEMGATAEFVKQDPCKVSINIDGLGMPAEEIQEFLYREYGVYVNRITENSILLNFHIGITAEAIDAMLNGLAALQRQQVSKSLHRIKADRFIIPYPPGVPLVVPGEEITADIMQKIEKIKKAGIALLEI